MEEEEGQALGAEPAELDDDSGPLDPSADPWGSRVPPDRSRARGVLISAFFAILYAGAVVFVDIPGTAVVALLILGPPYALAMWLGLRRRELSAYADDEPSPAAQRAAKAVIVFLLLYVPFTFVSDDIIPYAPIVEYGLFAAALFFLMRMVGRSMGVAGSVEALPPAHHRSHQQVVGAIDDPHYQETVMQQFAYVDRGRGARQLVDRLGAVMRRSGVDEGRIVEILDPIEQAGTSVIASFTPGARVRGERARERRLSALRNVIHHFNQELEGTS